MHTFCQLLFKYSIYLFIYIKKEKDIDFKTIICVTKYVLMKKTSTPCFCLFVNGRNFPYIFLTSSDNKLNEWTNQIAIYCHKLSRITSLQNASSKYYIIIYDLKSF